jgi:hypothetical protein
LKLQVPINLPTSKKSVCCQVKWSNDKEGLYFDFCCTKNNPKLWQTIQMVSITLLREARFLHWENKCRKQFLKPYRTLIGHLRHEVGHYFFGIDWLL